MRFSSKAQRTSDLLRPFYFHLEALETAIVHPKFLDDELMSSLKLTPADADYSFAVVDFIDHCAGLEGAPTTKSNRTTVLSALSELQNRIPSSTFDYRFCRYELEQLRFFVTSIGRTADE